MANNNQTKWKVITDEIFNIIEKGETLPWRKPWGVTSTTPLNFSTKRPYTGFNFFKLVLIAQDRGYKHNMWLTFNQIKKMNLKLNKGSKSTTVAYFNFFKKKEVITDEIGNTEEVETTIPVLKYYRVFNVEDTNAQIKDNEPIMTENLSLNERCEKTIEGYVKREKSLKLSIEESDRAFYSPMLDKVVVPELKQYKDEGEYYSTLFHELVHSTGHKDRLDRFEDGLTQFGGEIYSKEELVAEIGASILCQTHGFTNTMNNSASYIKGWMKKLKDKPSQFVSACNKAYKSVSYIKEGK